MQNTTSHARVIIVAFHFEMASNLRAPFRVASVSNCANFLRILWADGEKSKFSNIWLRASVRHPKFFDAHSLLYRQRDYANFIAHGVPLTGVEYLNGEEDVTIHWENHSSRFNASWLRAQDHANNKQLIQEPDEVLWNGESKLPVMYHYSQREEKLESWMTDLRRYGLAYFEGVPPNDEGLEEVMHQIGVLKQRFHPTDKLIITTDPNLAKSIDQDIYNNDAHPVHTDTAYYANPVRISGLLATQYHAPDQDTLNFFVDCHKVADEIRRQDPAAYQLLSTIPIRLARRRMNVQEECEPCKVRIYQYDSFLETPLIAYDQERLPLVRFSNKQTGFEIGTIADHSIMEKYYEAFLLLESKLSDPSNQQQIVLKAGTMALFNNNRVAHSRGPIHPTTRRSILLGFMSDEMWKTRWRVIRGEKSGLEEKWLYGCSDQALQMLANRKKSVNERDWIDKQKLSAAE